MHLRSLNSIKLCIVFIVLHTEYFLCNTVDTASTGEYFCIDNQYVLLNKEKCYDELGCIKLAPEWYHPKYRPVNLLPSDRHAVNTIFVNWVTRNSKVSPEVIGSNCANFSNNSKLTLLVHDFTSNGYITWIQHLSRLLLSNPDSNLNVVSVDWNAGAEPPYDQAIANARLVALEIVQFLGNVHTKSSKPRDVQIIGHGLGAHIAGYVGKMNRLKRITALDPAGLYFEGMPSIVRLHKEDAEYIEVLHTNTFRNGQGNKELLGHVDFFANGGIKQPGCKDKLKSLNSIKRGDLKLGETLPGCSHKRSLKYYLETLINQSCTFIGIACKSYKDFLKGKCSCGVNSENCLRLNTLRPPRSLNNLYGYYFVTSSSRPFCAETLKVVMSVQSPPTEELYVNGYFNINIPQSIGDVNFLINENSKIRTLRTDTQHSFVVFRSTPPPLLLPIKRVKINWHHEPIPCFWCLPPLVTSLMLQKMSDDDNEKPQWFCAISSPTRDLKYILSKTSAFNNDDFKEQTLIPCKH